jgi:hypothetical protein
MSSFVTGHFDGKSIVPDVPLNIPLGQKLRVRIEIVDECEPHPLTKISLLAVDLGVDDLAERHDYYALRGNVGMTDDNP